MDTITNQASIVYGGSTTTSNTVSTEILSEYSMTATKTPLIATYIPGCQTTYVSHIDNTGAGAIYNLSVVDNLGNGALSYVPNSAVAYINGEATTVNVATGTNSVTFTIPATINSGDNVNIIYEAKTSTSQTGAITNTQVVSGNGGSTTGQAVTVTPNPTATITLGEYASLNVNKQASATSIYNGGALNYTFTITNDGNTTADSASFSDTFPTGYTVTSISYLPAGSTTPVTYDPSTYVTGTTLSIPDIDFPVGTGTLTVNGTYNGTSS